MDLVPWILQIGRARGGGGGGGAAAWQRVRSARGRLAAQAAARWHAYAYAEICELDDDHDRVCVQVVDKKLSRLAIHVAGGADQRVDRRAASVVVVVVVVERVKDSEDV